MEKLAKLHPVDSGLSVESLEDEIADLYSARSAARDRFRKATRDLAAKRGSSTECVKVQGQALKTMTALEKRILYLESLIERKKRTGGSAEFNID